MLQSHAAPRGQVPSWWVACTVGSCEGGST